MTIEREVLIERLSAHRAIGDSPVKELTWLVEKGEFKRYATGEIVLRKGETADIMIVMFSGHGSVYVDRGAGRRKVFEWGGGDVTGLMPFSRLRASIGEVIMDQAAETIVLHRDWFPELVRECPTITGHVVHAMIDRARHFTSADSQDEKMISLGRLAAGLAHELNNPASAAQRSAQTLVEALSRANEATMELARARLCEADYNSVAAFAAEAQVTRSTDAGSALERADREDAIADWLANEGVDAAVAATLAEAGFSPRRLDALAQSIPQDSLDVVLRWVTTDYAARSLASDVERAAHRIYQLVSAVKRFTYMDRAGVSAPTDVSSTIADTVTMLGAKAKAKNVVVSMDVPSSLPAIDAFGAELNQVWSNLIDNGLDAVHTGGHLEINAVVDVDSVVVRVIDDGPGIAETNLPRIFDPFFTTKPVGHGTGLGLDIARRIVRRHEGQIEVDSRPGRTEFRVTLPVKRPAAS